ncbi:polysaccharide biosynthesis protein [Pluralibacter gergoviae]|nr:polysaccharide biosynthesis protein [Pluralibacter gergoviae]
MTEKIISIFGLVFVTSFVAKYVGPSIYGTIALAMSIFQLVQMVSQLGTDVLIFKRLSRNTTSGNNLINATSLIRCLVYFILSVPVLIYYFISSDSSANYYLFAAFIACFFQAMDIYSIYYDATLNSKINTFINMGGLVVSLLFRWFIAFLNLDPLMLCIPIVLAPLLPFLVRYIYYKKTTEIEHIPYRHKKKYIRYILCAGLSFVIASLSVAIYTRLSLLMLGYFNGVKDVGLYSVAATLATSWSFILNSLITSSLPTIFAAQDEKSTIRKASKLNIVVILVSMPIIAGVYFLAQWFIVAFYGVEYLSSYTPLLILTLSTLFGSLGTISARLIAKYSGYVFLSKKMLIVAFFSFCINAILIYYYGIIGAASANVLTQFFSLTLFNYPFKQGIVLKLHINTLCYRKKN